MKHATSYVRTVRNDLLVHEHWYQVSSGHCFVYYTAGMQPACLSTFAAAVPHLNCSAFGRLAPELQSNELINHVKVRAFGDHILGSNNFCRSQYKQLCKHGVYSKLLE